MPGKRSIPLLIVCLLAACAREGGRQAPEDQTGAPAPHAFRVYEEAGVRTAASTGEPKYDGELFTYVKILELRQDPGVPGSLLSHPYSFFQLDEKGRFHLADSGDQRIAVFGPDGKYLFSYGGRGGGPGEFRALSPIAIRNGLVTVFDSAQYRSTLFTPDGDLVCLIHPPTGLGRLEGLEEIDENTLICSYQRYRVEGDIHLDLRGMVAVTSDGAVRARIETPYVRTMYIYSAGGGRVAESYPYLARPVVTYSPRHGLVRSVGSEPLIEIFDTQGVLRRRIVLDLPTEEIPRDDKLAVIEGIRARQGLEIWDYRDEEIEQSIENLQFPRHKSFWTTLFVDADGYFWLMIWEPPREEVTEWRAYYRLLSPEGEYLGETRWPGPVGTVAGDRLLTWDLNPGTGELNMPVVYRMQPLPAGFTFP